MNCTLTIPPMSTTMTAATPSNLESPEAAGGQGFADAWERNPDAEPYSLACRLDREGSVGRPRADRIPHARVAAPADNRGIKRSTSVANQPLDLRRDDRWTAGAAAADGACHWPLVWAGEVFPVQARCSLVTSSVLQVTTSATGPSGRNSLLASTGLASGRSSSRTGQSRSARKTGWRASSAARQVRTVGWQRASRVNACNSSRSI